MVQQVSTSPVKSESPLNAGQREKQQREQARNKVGTSSAKDGFQPAKSANERHSNSRQTGIATFAQISILPSLASQLQPKLKINPPNDKYEQEADRVAEQVMRMPAQQVQRKCVKCGAEEQIQKTQATAIQPKCAKCQQEENALQTKSLGTSEGVASAEMSQKIQHTRGQGQAMDTKVRSYMEPRFGLDFSKVRIHSDGQAAAMNREINARAFTLGSDIYFNQGAYQPERQEGKKLLAHELTHVVQQNKINRLIQRETDNEKEESTTDQETEQNTTDTSTSASENDAEEDAPAIDNALSLKASVGREGVNNYDDVKKVQKKLLELKLLSLPDYGKESPIEKMSSFKVVALTKNDADGSLEAVSEREETEPTQSKDRTISHTQLSGTIAAIEAFQRLIFKGWSDGTIDTAGKQITLKTLRDTDKAGLEKLRDTEKKRLAAEKLKKEKEEKEAKRQAFLSSPEAEALRSDTARNILKVYSTSFEFAGVEIFINIDNKGLGAMLAAIRNHELRIILAVFDLLPSEDRDDVAYNVCKNLSDEELVATNPTVLERLRLELTAGVTFPSEREQVARISEIIGGGEESASTADHVSTLKKQIDEGKIIFDYGSKKLKNQLLNENLADDSVRATNKLQGVVAYLAGLGETVRVSSVSSGKHAKESLHYSGRGVDIGNEEIAPKILPKLVKKIAELHIDEIIYDASLIDLDANTYNYDNGQPHEYSAGTIKEHRDHLHISVKK